jgi:signal transduction histidine kinase
MAEAQRRNRYIVETGFQLRFVTQILLFMFLAAFISAATIYYSIWMELGDKLAKVYPQGRLMTIFYATNVKLIFYLGGVSVLVFIVGMLLSHRIAGPVYRIKKNLEEMIAGNYSLRFNFRKNDELHDVAEVLNRLLDSLTKKK